jgi:hypothetical protein
MTLPDFPVGFIPLLGQAYAVIKGCINVTGAVIGMRGHGTSKKNYETCIP